MGHESDLGRSEREKAVRWKDFPEEILILGCVVRDMAKDERDDLFTSNHSTIYLFLLYHS
jgi:hypothetical protein